MGNFMSCVLICGAMEVVQVVNTNGRVEKLIRPIRAAELIWAHERYKAALASGFSSSALSSAPSSEAHVEKPKSSASSTPVQKASRESNTNNNKFVLLPLDPSKPGFNTPVAEVGCRAYNFQCLSEENVSVKHVRKSRNSSKSSSSNNSKNTSNNNVLTTGSGNGKQEQRPQCHPQAPPLGAAQNQSSNTVHPPFRVKKEGGVTTLVVSKRYLEQLLSEKELKTTSSSDMAAADILRDHNYLPSLHTQKQSSSRRSKASSSGRVSIWRPALESISESHHNNGNSVGSSNSGQLPHQSHHNRHHQQQIRRK